MKLEKLQREKRSWTERESLGVNALLTKSYPITELSSVIRVRCCWSIAQPTSLLQV